MAKIYNSELSKEITQGAKLQTAEGKIPNELAAQVVPVMEVNPKLLKPAKIVRYVAATTNATNTLYTTPTDKDFYLTGCMLTSAQDAASDNVGCNIRCSIDGAYQRVIQTTNIASTAGTNQLSVNLGSHPVKVDRGTVIYGAHGGTVGVTRLSAAIWGYLDEASNA